MTRLTISAAACLLCWPAAAYEARVVGVHDGDTLTALVDGHQQIKVRLANIDCPELKQPFGSRAKQALSELVFGQTVDIAAHDTDRYGRTVGVITVNGIAVNAALVAQGMCRVYAHYNHDRSLPAIEDEAHAARRGIWSLPDQEAPWDYRRNQRTR